jgi:PAS domain S-box-containing protein
LTRKINWWQIIAVLILVTGTIITVWSAHQQDQSLRTDLLIKTRLAEEGIGAGQVAALSGSAADLTSPEYQALKAQLERIRAATSQARFAYLMGQRPDGTIFFYADSEPPTSGDYSPPGQDYTEVPAVVGQVFVRENGVTEGPYSDRWGSWVSGFVPVTDPDTGNVIAVFGMDVDAADWNLVIFRDRLPMVIATLLILLLVLASARFQQLREEERRRIAESEELLREKEAFQRVLLDNLTSGIIIVDAKTHTIDLVNPAAAALFGTPPDQITGKKCHLFLCPADEGACPITDLHQEIDNAERILLSADGTKIPILKSVIKIHIGGREKLLENFIDITRRKDAEAALQRQTATLSILTDIISTANKADDLPQLLSSILKESLRLLDFDAGGIYLVDRFTRTANVVHSKNLPEEFLAEIRTVSIDKKPYDTLFIKNEPLITEHYEQINPDRSKRYGFHSMASIPLLSKGEAIGALNVTSTRRHVISEEEKQMLISISRELGSTIERMTAEEEVKKTSKNLETLFNSIDEMIFVLDMQGRVLKVNKTVERRLGYSDAELHNTDVLLLHVPERREEALINVQGMIACTIDSCPVPLLTKNKEIIEVETKVTRGWWNGKEVLIGVTRDVTERKRAEEELRESEERFRISAQSVSDVIWDWNIPDGRLEWYGRIDEILGYAEGEFSRTIDAWEKIIHPDDRDRVMSMLDRHVKTQTPYATEYRVIRKEGEIRTWTDRGTAMLDENGKAYRMVGSCSDITERKQAEEEQARLAAIVEYSEDAIIGKTLDGIITSWNAGAERIYGYSAQEMVGKSISLLVPPDHPDDTGLIFERIRNGEPVIHYETLRRKKDGGLINVSLTASQIRDTQNRLTGISTIAHDITKRKLVEEALRASEIRYRRLFETAQDGILILNAETGQIVDVNPFLIDLLGFSHELFLGKKIWEIGVFKDIVANKDNFEELQRKEYIRYEDLPLETAYGRRIAVEFVSNVYTVNNKKVIQCNIRDITERKQAEEHLKKTETEYRSLISNSADIIAVVDYTGDFFFLSPSFDSVLGYREGTIRIRNVFELIHPDDVRAARETMQSSAESPGEIRSVELRLRHADGSWRIMDVVGRTSSWGEHDRVILVSARDVTERKKMTEQIEASLAEKETLLKEIHHRVKNNLQIITSMLNLQIRNIDDPTTIEVLKDSQSRVRSMALVHEHLYRGKDFAHIDLGNYIRALGMGLFQSYEAAKQGIRFDLNIKDIYVDINTSIPLGLISNELITNSLKYAFKEKKNGKISITATEDSQALTFVVADNGAGMPEGITLENQTSLGLRLVSLLTGQLKGTVTIDRTEGTKFVFTIPKGAEQKPTGEP